MIRRIFLKTIGLGAIASLFGNIPKLQSKEILEIQNPIYFDGWCLGYYKGCRISYDLDKIYELNLIGPFHRYVNFPEEYTLHIKYTNGEIISKTYNLKREDILDIVKAKSKDIVIDEIKNSVSVKGYNFKLFRVTSNSKTI